MIDDDPASVFSLTHHPCACTISPGNKSGIYGLGLRVEDGCRESALVTGQPLDSPNCTEKVPCEQTLLRSSYQNRKIEGDTARRALGKGFRLKGFTKRFSKLKIIFDAVYSDVYAGLVILGSYAD